MRNCVQYSGSGSAGVVASHRAPGDAKSALAEANAAVERLKREAKERERVLAEREKHFVALRAEKLLFYATAPLGRAAAKARGGARSKSAHSLTMPLPPV